MPVRSKRSETGGAQSSLLSHSSSQRKNGETERNKNKKGAARSEQKGHRRRIVLAFLTRLIFLIHTAVAVWRVSLYYPSTLLYFLSIGVAGLLIETTITIGVRRGEEYKWFCPSFFFYLLSVVPCLWLLQLHQLKAISDGGVPSDQFTQTVDHSTINTPVLPSVSWNPSDQSLYSNLLQRYSNLRKHNDSLWKTKNGNQSGFDEITFQLNPTSAAILNRTSNSTNQIDLFTPSAHSTLEMSKPTKKEKSERTERTSSFVTVAVNRNATEEGKNAGAVLRAIGDSISGIGETAAQFLETVEDDTWLLTLHQVLLFVLVLGRWLLPKGKITRDQLSQLLLVFIGVGADILEFVTETIDFDSIEQSNTAQLSLLSYAIYAVWSWSLLQFSLVLTTSKAQKTRLGFTGDRVSILSGINSCCRGSIFNDVDFWGIVVNMLLQDVPFLAFRLFAMIRYNQIHQMMVFFTGKNVLVVTLQIYRLVVLKIEHRSSDKEKDISQAELQPLRDTLTRLTSQSESGTALANGTLERASFKRSNNGSITVKLHLSEEATDGLDA